MSKSTVSTWIQNFLPIDPQTQANKICPGTTSKRIYKNEWNENIYQTDILGQVIWKL